MTTSSQPTAVEPNPWDIDDMMLIDSTAARTSGTGVGPSLVVGLSIAIVVGFAVGVLTAYGQGRLSD